MAENVYEVIKSNNTGLMEKLDTNHDLCTFLMLIYSHLLYIASENPGDPKDLILTPSIVMERLLKIEVKYSTSGDRPSRRLVVSGTDKVFSKRNPTIVRLVEVNKSVKDLPVNIVQMIENWISEKPYRKECGFANLRFENQRLWKNLIFTTEIIMKAEFDYDTIKQMGWDKEPEQPTEEERRIILP